MIATLRLSLGLALVAGPGASMFAASAAAQDASPPSPLELRSENGARAQALLIQLGDHLVPPRHRLGVGLEVQAMTLFHGPAPGALRERSWTKSLQVFSGRGGWTMDELTRDTASPGSEGNRSLYRNFDAERDSKLGLRAHVEDLLTQYAVFPEALVTLLQRAGAVRGIVDLGGETGIFVQIPGGEVMLRTVELEYGGERVPGLVGFDWLVHDELLGDVVGRLEYDRGEGPFPGVVSGFRWSGPMGEWGRVKAVSVQEDAGSSRFGWLRRKGTVEPLGPDDIEVLWDVLGEDLFEARLPLFDARVLALALPEGGAVMEAPVCTGAGRAILRALKKERPGLPVAYVLASHHHPHYVGGMRPFVAEGAAVVCPEGVAAYVEHLLSRPRTLFPDRLAEEIRTERQIEPRIIGVAPGDRWSPDGCCERLVAVEAAGESQHTDDFLVFFLSKEKLAFGGDLLWLPVEGRRTAPSLRTRGLAAILEGSGLPVEEFLTSWPVKGTVAEKRGKPAEPTAWRDRALLQDILDEAKR